MPILEEPREQSLGDVIRKIQESYLTLCQMFEDADPIKALEIYKAYARQLGKDELTDVEKRQAIINHYVSRKMARKPCGLYDVTFLDEEGHIMSIERYIEAKSYEVAISIAEQSTDKEPEHIIVDHVVEGWMPPVSGEIYHSTVDFDAAIKKYKEREGILELSRSDELRAFIEELLDNVYRD